MIEDDPHVQQTVQVGLARDTSEIVMVSTGQAALEFLQTRMVDLVLLDIGLPDMDGFDLLERMKSNPALVRVPVLLLTARDTLDEKVRAFDTGASDYITKPFDVPELRARVRAILRSKRLQDDLAETNRELEAARIAAESATRAKSDFLAQMSHEIRTPMNGVIGMARLLMESNLPPQQKELAETILHSGDSLLTIINDILDFSKIESGKMELESHPFELSGCVEDVLDLLAAKAEEKNLELSYEIEDGAPAVVIGDSTRLRQILLNLVSNAIKFTAAGEVAVRLRAEREAPAPGEKTASWRLFVSVRDTGIGIPSDKFGMLFQSFSQVDASTTRHYGGTGLGLAICKSLAVLMGGDVDVESLVGVGSTFHFHIRVQSTHVPAGLNETSQPGALAGMKILIVDDNATNRRLLTLQTKKWGIDCEASESGAAALEVLRGGKAFDAAILDMQMPGMDGVMLARNIRGEFPKLKMPLALLTSMGLWADTPKEETALFISCVNKPVKPTQLFSILVLIREGAKRSLPQAPPPPKPESTLAQRFPLQLLLVDDNVINQKVATRLLQQAGYRADVAGNGREALEAVQRHPYDMVLMDVQMPEMDGLEATRQIRKADLGRPSPIIIAMTANAMHGDREKCIDSGMNDYVTKPIQPEKLFKAIEEWAGKLYAQRAGAQSSEPVAETPPAEANPTPAAAPAPASEPAKAPALVNVQRLEQFTDGTFENLQELVDLYLCQTAEQIQDLGKALQSGDKEEIRRLAHKAAGSSGTCGMDALTDLLREIEHKAAAGNIAEAAKQIGDVEDGFVRVQEYLEDYMATRKR
jgi:CheY-like chemotaxis protein/HPt (histidine-containing phosphotransfer) domain-containing protein